MLAALVMFRLGKGATGTLAEAVSGPVSLESAAAVFSNKPSPPPLESISAWVTVCWALKLQVSPTSNRASPSPTTSAPRTGAAFAYGSVTVKPVSVVLPVFCTVMT